MPEAAPRGAKLAGGVWLPESEEHFTDMMLRNPKRMRVVDGKHTYQYHKLEAALANLPRERRRTAVDIGGHVGLWAMWLVDHFRQVHIFEPVPPFADILPHNMRGRTNWTVHRFALGITAQNISMTVPLAQTGAAHVSTRAPVNVKYDVHGETDTWHAVPMRRLDDFEFSEVDFLKIDVEGYELPVIEGGAETIRRCRPVIIVEQKGNDTAYGQPRNAALAKLKSWGMRELAVVSGDYILDW